MRWSYKTIHFELKKEGLLGGAFLDVPEIEQALNEYGRRGWELVSIIETGDGLVGVLKQPIDTHRDQPSEEGPDASALTLVAPLTVTDDLVRSKHEESEEYDLPAELAEEAEGSGGAAPDVPLDGVTGELREWHQGANDDVNRQSVGPDVVEVPDETGTLHSGDEEELLAPLDVQEDYGEDELVEASSALEQESAAQNDDRQDDQEDDQDLGVGSIRIE